MAPETVFLIAVLILVLAGLIAFCIVMYQNLKRLTRTLSAFQAEVQPIVEDIQREAEQASEVAAKLSESIPGKDPGDKIRR